MKRKYVPIEQLLVDGADITEPEDMDEEMLIHLEVLGETCPVCGRDSLRVLADAWGSMEVHCVKCNTVWGEREGWLVVDRKSPKTRLFLRMEADELHPNAAAKLAALGADIPDPEDA